ncbi:hypothetical protein UFOVP23_38 [uncultured Caudovirales phage]|uniref:Uncharacterized protein n=1 Tax=uncultured Caudovirales phage TaxID=2100421 RepID=A0A6J5T8P1_9CAUD|nr:hypothetical protein UFOVP23_38 [uncultured Caudovirales phage]
MSSKDLINKFTAGELEPRVIAQVDYDGYRKGARRLRNVITIPQGGVTKRFGTNFIKQIVDNAGAPITDPEQLRLIGYEHVSGTIYYVVIRPQLVGGTTICFDIYAEDTFIMTVNAAPATYTVSMIRDIRWVKSFDIIILLHKQVPPYALRRTSSSTWNINLIPFQFYPTYDFTDQDDPATLPTPNVPYTSSTVTFTPDAMAATMITANMAVYTSNHVGGLFIGNMGVARITAVNAAGTVATVKTLVDFEDTSAIPGDLSTLQETAWNNGGVIGGAPAGPVRGWPGYGAIFQSRLFLGGSPQLPNFVFGSGIKVFYDFDNSMSSPDFGIGLQLNVTGTDILTGIVANKTLVLIGTKGTASTSALMEDPLTPLTAFATVQGSEPSRNMDPVILDNQILYADRDGNTIWSMGLEIPDTGYSIDNISFLSSHLIREPRWGNVFDPAQIDGRYYMLVNGDGTMAIFNSIESQNIHAWTLAETTGSFIDAASINDECKLLVRRKQSTTGLYITGHPEQVYNVDSTFTAFRNVTPTIVDASGTLVFATEGDYLLIGSEIPFNSISVTLGFASINLLPTYQFLNDLGTWETFVPMSDSTNGWSHNGIIAWEHSQVASWTAQTVPLTDLHYDELDVLYWIRVQRTIATPIVTPLIDTLFIDTQDVVYMEDGTFDNYMDCQAFTISDSTGNVSALPWAGQNVFVFANDFPMGTYYVPSTGVFKVTYGGANIGLGNAMITLGLEADPEVITMPIIAILQNGYSVYDPLHVDKVYIDYYQSLAMVFDGQNYPQVVPGMFMTQNIPQPMTGYYKIPPFGGWDPRYAFLLTQSYPAPYTILAVSYTFKVAP